MYVTLNKSYGDLDKHHHWSKIIVQDEFKNGSANPVAMSGLFGHFAQMGESVCLNILKPIAHCMLFNPEDCYYVFLILFCIQTKLLH